MPRAHAQLFFDSKGVINRRAAQPRTASSLSTWTCLSRRLQAAEQERKSSRVFSKPLGWTWASQDGDLFYGRISSAASEPCAESGLIQMLTLAGSTTNRF